MNNNLIEFEGFKIPIETITEEDMPNEILKEVYGLNGKDVAISLMLYQRGVTIQVPSKPFEKIKKRILKDMYDGTTASIRKIARTFGLAEGRIREILKDQSFDVPDERQIGLFDNAQ